jgi:hypothetical protein
MVPIVPMVELTQGSPEMELLLQTTQLTRIDSMVLFKIMHQLILLNLITEIMADSQSQISQLGHLNQISPILLSSISITIKPLELMRTEILSHLMMSL